MAGLVPAIHVFFNRGMAGGWFYFMTNRRNGVLYAGVTSNLPRRAFEHHAGLVEGFTKRYGLKILVYCERNDAVAATMRGDTSRRRHFTSPPAGWD
jgi:putative endonuclease